MPTRVLALKRRGQLCLHSAVRGLLREMGKSQKEVRTEGTQGTAPGPGDPNVLFS